MGTQKSRRKSHPGDTENTTVKEKLLGIPRTGAKKKGNFKTFSNYPGTQKPLPKDTAREATFRSPVHK